MEPFFIKAIIIYLILLIWLYFAGSFTSKMLSIKTFGTYKYFVNIAIGLLLTSSLVSFFYTDYKSSLLAPLIIGIIYAVSQKKHKIKTSEKETSFQPKKIIIVLIGSILIFSINVFVRQKGAELWPLFGAGKDEIFYSLVSNFINNKGIENYNIDWFFYTDKINPLPYHYLEQWLNIILIKLFNFNSLHSLLFIIFPVFQYLFFLGILSLLEKSKQNIIFITILAFILTFSSYISSNFFESYNISLTTFHKGLKYYPFYCLFIILLNLIKDKRYNDALIVFALSPYLNYLFYPIIAVTFILYIVSQKIILKRQINWRVIAVFSISIAYIPILSIFSPQGPNIPELGIDAIKNFYSDNILIKVQRIFVMGAAYTIQNTLSLFSLLIFLITIFGIYFKRLIKNKFFIRIFLFTATLILSSLIIASILYFVMDSAQIFNLFIRTSTIIVTLYCIAYLFTNYWNKKKWPFLIFFGIQLLLITYTYSNKICARNFNYLRGYSISYLKKIEDITNKYPDKKWIGGRLLPKEYYNSIYDIRSIDQYEGFPFAFFTNNLTLFTLNEVPLLVDKYGVYNFNYNFLVPKEFFNCYAQKHNFNIKDKKNLRSAQQKFIKEIGINFIVAYHGAEIPDFIEEKAQHTFYDPHNKEKILILE